MFKKSKEVANSNKQQAIMSSPGVGNIWSSIKKGVSVFLLLSALLTTFLLFFVLFMTSWGNHHALEEILF